jgi:hypothetical protein
MVAVCGPEQLAAPGEPGGNMTEDEYLAGEFADAEIDKLADAGEHFLEEQGFYHKVGGHRFDA